MPMTYRISGRAVRFTEHGKVKHTEVLATLNRAFKEIQRTHPGTADWDFIVDVRDSSSVRTEMELQGYTMVLKQYPTLLSGRVAVVVPDSEVTKPLRSFAPVAERSGTKPQFFRTLKEAEAWLKAARKRR